jgi:hypothetical protein
VKKAGVHPTAPLPVVHSPANLTKPPTAVPPVGSSGSSLFDRSVLLITFMIAIGVAVLALIARGLWRRVWWWRHYFP